jgi:AcrR family transcriptional regulator
MDNAEIELEQKVAEGSGEVTLSRRERRRVETRERLYEAAMRLLSERDFDDVTVEMITEAADVGKGTFFNYFANKEAVVTYRFETELRNMTEMLRQLSEGAEFTLPEDAVAIPAYGGPFTQRMRAMIYMDIKREAYNKRLMRNLLALILTNAQVRAAHVSVMGRMAEALTDLMRAGQDCGELRSDYPPGVLTEYLMDVYFHTMHRWAQSETEETLPAALDRNFALAWEGIGRPTERKA